LPQADLTFEKRMYFAPDCQTHRAQNVFLRISRFQTGFYLNCTKTKRVRKTYVVNSENTRCAKKALFENKPVNSDIDIA